MIGLAEIEAAIRLFGTLKDRRLTAEEKELLVAVRDAEGNRRDLVLVESDQVDPWIRVMGSKTTFMGDGDPRYIAKYRTALSNLIKRGFVEPSSHKSFRLTGEGWNAADKI